MHEADALTGQADPSIARTITGVGERSAYDTLRVMPTATFRQIRFAYLALIKQSHPDIAGPIAASPSATDVNRAYWVLSDPERRACYDQSLLTAFPVLLRMPRSLAAPVPTRARLRWGRLLFIVCGLATAAAVTVYAKSGRPWQSRPAASSPIGLRFAQRHVVEERPAIVNEAQLNFEWIALQSDALAVARFSATCWANLKDDRSERLLDYCLAFDSAARRTYGAAARYFDVPMMVGRAQTAAGQLDRSGSLRARVKSIDAMITKVRVNPMREQPSDNWFTLVPPGLPRPGARPAK